MPESAVSYPKDTNTPINYGFPMASTETLKELKSRMQSSQANPGTFHVGNPVPYDNHSAYDNGHRTFSVNYGDVNTNTGVRRTRQKNRRRCHHQGHHPRRLGPHP